MLGFNKQVHVQTSGKDRCARALAYNYLEDSTELSKAMIDAGYASHYKKYNLEESLAAKEAHFQKEKSGIWQNSNPNVSLKK